MTLNIKNKIFFGRNCILDNYITRKFELHGVFLWIKDPDPVFSRIRIRVTQKDRIQVTQKDRIRVTNKDRIRNTGFYT